MHKIGHLLLAIITGSAILLVIALPLSATELKIGLIPEQDVFTQRERYQILADYIEKQTGIHITYLILTRYGNIIDNFKSAGLDGAFFGSFTGALAIGKLDLEFLARPVNLNGKSTYCGYIFVRKGSNIRNIRDMKQKCIVFVDRATTAGYVYPLAFFRKQGVLDIDAYFRESYFSGSHDAAIQAVLDGKADIGCAKDTIYNLFSGHNADLSTRLDIIAMSPMVPSNGLGVRSNLSEKIKQQLRETLLGMNNNPAGLKALQQFHALRFIPTNNDDYASVFKIAAQASINMMTYRYNNK